MVFICGELMLNQYLPLYILHIHRFKSLAKALITLINFKRTVSEHCIGKVDKCNILTYKTGGDFRFRADGIDLENLAYYRLLSFAERSSLRMQHWIKVGLFCILYCGFENLKGYCKNFEILSWSRIFWKNLNSLPKMSLNQALF